MVPRPFFFFFLVVHVHMCKRNSVKVHAVCKCVYMYVGMMCSGVCMTCRGLCVGMMCKGVCMVCRGLCVGWCVGACVCRGGV